MQKNDNEFYTFTIKSIFIQFKNLHRERAKVKITKKEEKFSEHFLKDAIGNLKSIIVCDCRRNEVINVNLYQISKEKEGSKNTKKNKD